MRSSGIAFNWMLRAFEDILIWQRILIRPKMRTITRYTRAVHNLQCLDGFYNSENNPCFMIGILSMSKTLHTAAATAGSAVPPSKEIQVSRAFCASLYIIKIDEHTYMH